MVAVNISQLKKIVKYERKKKTLAVGPRKLWACEYPVSGQ